MMAWGAVGLVVVIIVVLVIVKASSNSSTQTPPIHRSPPAPASVVHDVTNIPESVYNTVGVNSPTVPVTPPTILSNQPPDDPRRQVPGHALLRRRVLPLLRRRAVGHHRGPVPLRYVVATSRSPRRPTTDVDPATHTFSFHGATLTSQYITFTGVEQYTNVPTSTPGAYTNLQNPTAKEKANILKYSSSKFNPNATSSGGISFPYVNINNVALFSGASYSPGILAGQTWDQIASGLSDPSNPATQAIVTTGQLHVGGHLRQHRATLRPRSAPAPGSRPRPRP